MVKKLIFSLIMVMALCTGVCAESVRYTPETKTLENTGSYIIVKKDGVNYYSGSGDSIKGVEFTKGEKMLLLRWNSYADIKPLAEPKEYTYCDVVFMIDGETVAQTTDFIENKDYIPPTTEGKEGYEIKWSRVKEKDNVVTMNGEYVPLDYNITFYADGNKVATETFNLENKNITLPAIPPKTGYSAKWEELSLDTPGDKTVNAVYTPVEYTVTFTADGFSKEETYTIEAMKITEPSVPEKEGYKGKWESYTLNFEDITVKAVYEPIEYKATFNADGKFVAERSFTIENKNITEPSVPSKAGYEGKWEEYTLTLSDVTINAAYTPVEYTVTFVADGQQVAQESYNVEKLEITEPSVPEKEGYTGKWESYSLSLENTSVNAIYTPIEYKATFVAEGKIVESCTYTVESDSIKEPSVPVKTGYTGSWESYQLTVGGVWVNAVYTPNTYIVSFDVNGGETLDVAQLGEAFYEEEGVVKADVVYDGEYPQLPVPTHSDEALEFAGWSVEGVSVGNRVAITKDSTFTAVWTDKPVYQVIFNDYYGEGQHRTLSILEGKTITKPENPVKAGYIFDCWHTEENTKYDFSSLVTGAVNLYPKWSAEIYSVTFKADNNVVSTESYSVENYNITEPSVPEKEGYTGKWEEYELNMGNVTVNAVYTLVDYTITFVADGNKISTQTYNVENKGITEPQPVAKTGYTAKWEEYTLENLGNITVNAIYTPIEYTVTFTADSEVVAQESYTIENLQINQPSVPEKAGYTGKWESYGLNLENITVKAIYTPVEYTVTFVAEGKQVSVEKYTIETTEITEPKVTSKAGYEGAWEEYSLKELGNITVNAVYTPIVYTVTFVVDDVAVSTQTYTVEKLEITEPALEVREGYTSKWESYSLSLENLTVNAVYTPVVYTIVFGAEGETVATETFTVESMQINEPSVPEKAGYSGVWQSYTLKLEDMFVSAVYTPVNYKVTFKVNGIKYAERTFNAENMSIKEPSVPPKTGYSARWEDYTLSYNNITVNAVYDIINYTVTFVADGEEVAKETYDVNFVYVSEPSVPAKTGYTASWEEYSLDMEDLTVNAVYTPIEYKITFKANGTTVDTVTFTIETMNNITPPAVPEKEGYSASWAEFTPALKNMTVNAVYEMINCKVTFVANGSTIAIRTYNINNKSITVPSVPGKTGYTAAWESYELNFKDVVVNAVYTPIEYKITYKADGVVVDEIVYTIENMNVTDPKVPEKAGYSGAWQAYSLTLSDRTVNAVYTIINYTVTFKADGNVVASRTYTVNNKNISVPTVPEKTGYTAAWESYSLDNLGNLTVNAVYTPIEYTVKFVADGVEVTSSSYTVENSSVTAPAVPEKEWYNGAWETYTLSTGDVTVNAVYTIANYTATFKAEGQTVATTSYNLNNTDVAPSIDVIPAKENHRAVWERYEAVPGGMTINARYIPAETDEENEEEDYHFNIMVQVFGGHVFTGAKRVVIENIMSVGEGIVADIDYGILITEEYIKTTYEQIINETKEIYANVEDQTEFQAETVRLFKDYGDTYRYFEAFYDKYF